MININLIANRRAKKMREMTFLRFAIMGVIIVFMAMLFLNLYALLMQRIAVDQYNVAVQRLEDIQEDEKDFNKILDEIKEKVPQTNLLERAQQSQAAWATILADFSRMLPHDVVLTNMSTAIVDKNMGVQIGGYAADEQTLGQFMIDLRTKTEWAGKPKLGTVSAVENDLTKERRVRFDLMVPIMGMMAGDF